MGSTVGYEDEAPFLPTQGQQAHRDLCVTSWFTVDGRGVTGEPKSPLCSWTTGCTVYPMLRSDLSLGASSGNLVSVNPDDRLARGTRTLKSLGEGLSLVTYPLVLPSHLCY
jgi:hypothetical protein